MKIYSYIITDDTGFSPNPFWGYCTLANCKPAIRRTAGEGDWIVGLTPKSTGNKIVYAIKVSEIMTYNEYYHDIRFKSKLPDFTKADVVYKCGDNIYEPLPTGGYRQLRSMHSNGEIENEETKKHDLSGRNVLVSKEFYYFGSCARELIDKLDDMKVGRAHKCRFSPEVISSFLDFIAGEKQGIHGPPSIWPKTDKSWMQNIT